MKKINIEQVKKISKAIGYKSITFFLYLMLFLSLLPMVSWYAGLIVVPICIVLVFFIIIKKKQLNPKDKRTFMNSWVRISFITIVFGVFGYLGCKVNSNAQIEELYQECQTQKKEAFSIKIDDFLKKKQDEKKLK